MDHDAKVKVGIAISSLEMMHAAFTQCLADLIIESLSNNILIDVEVVVGKPVDKSRTLCVLKLLKKDPEYILFLDTDMIFQPDLLLNLMKQEKDLITGVACMRYPPFSPAMGLWDDEKDEPVMLMGYPRDKLFKIGTCGGACLLVKREVFEKVKKPWFKYDEYGGEDTYFCRKVRKEGYEIWADGRQEVGHWTYNTLTMENFWKNREHLKKLAEPLVKSGRIRFAESGMETEEPK